MHLAARDGFDFPSDNPVPSPVGSYSRLWQREQFHTVISGFTHVVIESALPLFGNLYSRDVAAEVRQLRGAGLSVAMLSHGSDLRLPSRHRELDEWSPFRDQSWELLPMLEARALSHRRLLAEVQAPVYVATPDLLLDWPEAIWIPIVVNPSLWTSNAPPLVRARPVVVHAPTSSILKGSDLIESSMQRLHDEGVIEYRRIQGVKSAQMPAIYKDADIVLDQFRLGNYATTAIEAMAAGRLVVAYVHDQVREHIRATYGTDVPVVQATVKTLERVIRDIVSEREAYTAIAAEGPIFVGRVHDGAASAEVLRPFLLS